MDKLYFTFCNNKLCKNRISYALLRSVCQQLYNVSVITNGNLTWLRVFHVTSQREQCSLPWDLMTLSMPTILLRLWPKIITVGLHVDAITEDVRV